MENENERLNIRLKIEQGLANNNILKISDHVFKISELQLEYLLHNHFLNDDINKLRKPSLWLLITLLVEIIVLSFLGTDDFVSYKLHIIFSIILILSFAWDSYISWKIKKSSINKFLTELKELGL